MRNLFLFVFFIALVQCEGFAQLAGARDLTHLRPATERTPPKPPSCKTMRGRIADGWRPRDEGEALKLEILDSEPKAIESGSNFRLKVRLTNVGEKPITIPWSIDQNIVNGNSYEVGTLSLSGGTAASDCTQELEVGPALFATPNNPKTHLTLNPNQWIEIVVSTKAADCPEEGKCTALKPTEEYFIEASWSEHSQSREVKGCEVTNFAYFIRRAESGKSSVTILPRSSAAK